MKLPLTPIPTDAPVILGVSGGRDSMSLAHALKTQYPELTLITAHLNHGLRADADDDAAFVDGMMQRWDLPCEHYKPRAPKSGNVEDWGRTKRYEFFDKLRRKHKAAHVLTAHHQDDDFESMLLHFFRGTRVKGLSGMRPQREHLLRPLLFTPRETIDAYVEHHNIPFREDPTNADDTLRRNFLRHKIIPVLQHMYPGVAERWQKQKDYWLELQALLETSAQVFLDEFLSQDGLAREPYRQLPFPTRATVLELWYRQSTGHFVPDSSTLERWDTAIRTWNSRKKTEWDATRFLTLTKTHARLA